MKTNLNGSMHRNINRMIQQKNEDPRTPFLQETDWYWVEMVGIRMYFLLNQLSSGYQLETIHVIPENPCFLTIFHLPGCPLQDGVLSEREFKKFFECFPRYAFFDVVCALSCFLAQGTAGVLALFRGSHFLGISCIRRFDLFDPKSDPSVGLIVL